MGKYLLLITLIAMLSVTLFLACASRSSQSTAGLESTAPSEAPMAFATPSPYDTSGSPGMGVTGGPMGAAGEEGAFPDALDYDKAQRDDFSGGTAPEPGLPELTGGDGNASNSLQTTQRQIISSASVSIEVETVEPAIDQVRAIAEGLGGFVEQLSSHGSGKDQQANLTLRVPQDQFFTAVDRIEALGKVQGRNLGSEDVSEEFIDLEARLKSSLQEEASLLSLLERATQVSEILTIERELSRVRSDIERVQGRLNFLERRVDLATISVSLFPPGARLPEPPSANTSIEHSNVSARVDAVRDLAASLNGEIDQVLRSTQEGRDRADISFRVFPKDFEQALSVVESEGKIVSRNVREGFNSPQAQDEPPEDPNARINVSFAEPVTGYLWLKILIAAVLAVAILSVAFYLTFRAGRNRTDRFIQSAP
jgi:hypothetical protein